MYRNFELNTSPKIIGYEWKCERPGSVVVLVHGIGEHAGRYDRVAEVFKASGIAMIAMDLRGHGLSSGKRGHTAPRDRILADIDILIEYCMKEYPDVPMFLYGHSMGGNIALDYRLRGKYRLMPQCYIITSPWLILKQRIPRYLYLFTQLIAALKPDFQMSSKIQPELLGNMGVISKQENGHLVHGKITVQTALDGLRIAEKILNGRLAQMGDEPPKPFLLMHGDQDMICDPEGSKRLAKLEGDRCLYIEWPGLLHEIHNGSQTSDGMEVIQVINDWILQFIVS
jgi:alpha-beta hydrolase superfamily lysophospholipase